MKTPIGWTNTSHNYLRWNCTPASPGCNNCYAMAMAQRWPGNANERDFLAPPALREKAFRDVGKLPPGPCFVCSMSDLFHPGVKTQWIHRVFNTFSQRSDITWLVLTKRIERAYYLAPYLAYGPNVWIGTTVEGANWTWRLDFLRRIKQAAGRFVSFEPLLDYINAPDLNGIDWVIAGGESGKYRRPFKKAWALAIWSAAKQKGLPFFYKQGSSLYPGKERLLLGQEFNEVPTAFNWTPEGEQENV